MNQEWSELNKTMQLQLKKEESFLDGINTLLILRQKLMEELLSMKKELEPKDFVAMPFPNAKGYHCKTIAYSIWHSQWLCGGAGKQSIYQNPIKRGRPADCKGYIQISVNKDGNVNVTEETTC